MMQQLPRIYVYQAPTTHVRENFASTTARKLGIFQLIFGVILILLQIISIIIKADLSFLGHGIWTAIFMILAGSFGIAAAARRSSCLIISFMVLSILAAVFATIPVALSATGIAFDTDGHYYWGCYGSCSASRDSRIAVTSLMLIVGLLETCVAIWSSVICCKELCCGRHSIGAEPVQYIAGPGNPQTMMIAPIPGQQQNYLITVPHTQQSGPVVMQQGQIPLNIPLNVQTQSGNASVPMQSGNFTPPPAYTAMTVPPMAQAVAMPSAAHQTASQSNEKKIPHAT